jgi:hypothetical protein
VCHKGTCCAPGEERLFDKTGYPICCERGETLCDQPQARGGVICCKKRCGPNITDALQDALARVRSEFAGWSAREKKLACTNLVTIPGGSISWDINELGPGGRQQFAAKHRPDCSTCGFSVQVYRDCHYSGSVNYVAYGVMMRLCHEHYRAEGPEWAAGAHSEDMMALFVGLHKGFTGRVAPNVRESAQWASAGYRGWPGDAPTPPGDRSECDLCSKQYTGPGLTVWWLPKFIRP